MDKLLIYLMSLPGLIGLRAIESNPERAMKYMVTSFGSNLKKQTTYLLHHC